MVLNPSGVGGIQCEKTGRQPCLVGKMGSVSHLPCDPIRATAQVLFVVEVFQQGAQIAAHTVEAPDALAAIDQIEGHYGAPLEAEDVLVDQDEKGGHHAMLVNNWHGYMFQARALCPVSENRPALEPGDQAVPVSSSRPA